MLMTNARRASLALCALMLAACAAQTAKEPATDVVAEERVIVTGNRADGTLAPPAPPPPPALAMQESQRAPMDARGRVGALAAPVGTPYAQSAPQPMPGTVDRDRYEDVATNPIHIAADEPVSTFSIDVDTASYSNVRRFLSEGRLPPRDAVRIEELINYFDYDYALPRNRDEPFSTTVAVAPSPWAEGRQLVHIGLQGYDIVAQSAPAAQSGAADRCFGLDGAGQQIAAGVAGFSHADRAIDRAR